MNKLKILITGANGQLGKCLQDASVDFQQFQFAFASREELDLGDATSVSDYFRKNTFDYCINTAAYTNVEQAEKEKDAAFAVNAEGVKLLAEICSEKNITLVHISTDYVFDGTKKTPYLENDATNPLNVYGASKLKGEEYIQQNCIKYFIVRTSWLYSQYGHNFLNTILKHAALGTELKITTEQTGTPTNANDLAQAILKIIEINSQQYGIYHFSNTGEATWYDFAKAIIDYSPQLNKANLAKTDHYPTFAKRPERSVLCLDKIENTFNLQLMDWKSRLQKTLTSKQ